MAERVENQDRERIRAVFAEVYRRPREQRPRYLEEACGDDAVLRTEVESLLAAYEAAGDFLETPPIGPGAALVETPIAEGPGTVIGRYKLLEKIGEGGMAVVYMAEQTEPIRRKVALKIIKLGMDTRQVIARFEAERQALAMMDHPHIAKVHDAGATETGRPYFVMELVQGVSITEYCDRNSLGTKDRLHLFLQVCQAVQHAHTKGIIHRDLKPSNVMVTHHDGRPVPKVIDFGIAKATDQKLTEKTLFTRYAHIIGTPAYMSPEQAELSDLDIDTRSDIYSLGVLLYELLTGTTPFSEEELRKAGYIEMQRVIREQEPVKPSTKLSTIGEILTDIAKRRNSTPDLLRRAIRGDLDWIVMKSLEKDRTRRYETASGFAEDIQRHLEHEPVRARGPGTTYRLCKFLRRHRVHVVAALSVALAAGAAAVLLPLWYRDRLQLGQAEGFRHRGLLSQAQGQYAQADRQGALKTITPLLRSRHVGPKAQLLYAAILVDGRRPTEAVTILENLLKERREIAGAAHALLARILWENESLDAENLQQIEEHRRQAEARRPETAEACFLRAVTAVTVKEQLALLDRALRLDASHYEARRLRAFLYYASRKYEKMEHDALGLTVGRPLDPLGYSLRATALRELNRYPEALEDYASALAVTPPDGPQYLDLAVQRCETFLRKGDHESAIAESQACLKRWPNRPVFHYHRFCGLTALGEYDAATTLFYQIVRSGPETRGLFEDWCAKYVFEVLAAGRPWHPLDREPAGAAFLPLVEAEESYRALSGKGRPLLTHGFSAQWSPDGKKLAFSLGVHGYSGVAISDPSGVALYDPATGETDLLIAPGKNPAWSPDGRYIAFVRDCQFVRIPEFTAGGLKDQPRPRTEEEVWLMKSDGADPRCLARGNWPSWSPDSTRVYYRSQADKALYAISFAGPDAEPKRIATCSGSFPALSSDRQRLAYLEGESLKVKDLASQAAGAEWKGPFTWWAGVDWSPQGDELCLGGKSSTEKRGGLWIYRFDRREPVKVLDGEVEVGSWSPDGTKLVFTLGTPFFEVWTADLDPGVSLVEALGPAQTKTEHFQELAALWTRRIAADPADPDNYLHRADHYRSLQEGAKARADARRYWAALHPGFPPGFRLEGSWSIMHTVSGPFDYQLVVFVERQEDGMVLLRAALGQKGRCEAKRLEVPLVLASLLGSCFLPDSQVPAARPDFKFGKPQNLETVNSPQRDECPVVSPDGLELYFFSTRPGGYGRWDIWRSRRARIEDPWGPPGHLGPEVNSAGDDAVTSLSSDGLTLYLFATTGIYADLYTATRPTRNDLWSPRINMGPVLNRPDDEVGGVMWGNDALPVISPDDMELHFASWRPGAIGLADIYVSTRATPADPWGPPENLGPLVNTAGNDFPTAISPDGLILFVAAENRPGGLGGFDAWMVRRPYKGGAWSEPVNLGSSFNTPQGDDLHSLLPDGRSCYLGEFSWTEGITRPDGCGDADLWMAPIIPIVGPNGDGRVDDADLKIFRAARDKEKPPAEP
jgi:tetratricopeptide (TPR) repeat protein